MWVLGDFKLDKNVTGPKGNYITGAQLRGGAPPITQRSCRGEAASLAEGGPPVPSQPSHVHRAGCSLGFQRVVGELESFCLKGLNTLTPRNGKEFGYLRPGGERLGRSWPCSEDQAVQQGHVRQSMSLPRGDGALCYYICICSQSNEPWVPAGVWGETGWPFVKMLQEGDLE